MVDKNDVTEVSLMMGIMRRKLIYSSIIITLYYAYFYDYFRFYFVTNKRYKRSKANREFQVSTEHGSTSANRNLISVPPATVITLQIMLSFTSQSCAILQVRIYPSFQFFIVYCFRKVKNNLSCCADMGRWTVWSSISTGTARWWPGEL